MELTDQQVKDYFEHGYLLLRELIPHNRLQVFNERFEALVNGDVALVDDMKVMQDVMVVKGAVVAQSPTHAVNKLLCLENDPALFSYACEPELVSAVQSLLGKSLYSLSSNVFNKPPGVDGRHPMHQDLRYFKLRPAAKIVGTWTAMLPAMRTHGCLSVIPGSHKGGLRDHENPDWQYVNHGFFGIQDLDLSQRVHIEMHPGDTLLFHPLTIHGSGRNRSGEFRRAISVHYAAGDCESPKLQWRTSGLTRKIS